jgi:hypothetical protein
MMKMQFQKQIIIMSILLIAAAGGCSVAPGIAQPAQSVSPTASNAEAKQPAETQTPSVSPSSTITPSLTTTPIPDVEFTQIQGYNSTLIAEIVNHLDVPVVFKDEELAFRFDVYDPGSKTRTHDEESPHRTTDIAPIPCVLYPGEHAYFMDSNPLYYLTNDYNLTDYSHLVITYQTFGLPTPDWKNNGTQPKVSNEQWKIQNDVLYFSFKHEPVFIPVKSTFYQHGTMGLYDKDDHLLGVAGGSIAPTAVSGIATGYWIRLSSNAHGNDRSKEWSAAAVKDLATRLDHIRVMIEAYKEDGICLK